MKGLPDLHPSHIKGDGTMRGAAVLALAASPSGSVYAVLCTPRIRSAAIPPMPSTETAGPLAMAATG